MEPGRRWLCVQVTRMEDDNILSESDRLTKALGELSMLQKKYSDMEKPTEAKQETAKSGELKESFNKQSRMLAKKLRKANKLEFKAGILREEVADGKLELAEIGAKINGQKRKFELKPESGKNDDSDEKRRKVLLTGKPMKRSESMIQKEARQPEPVQVLEYPDYPTRSESFSQTDHPDEATPPSQELQLNHSEEEAHGQEEAMEIDDDQQVIESNQAKPIAACPSSPPRGTGAESPLGADYGDALVDWAKSEVFGLVSGHSRQYQRQCSSDPVPSRTGSPVVGLGEICEEMNAALNQRREESMTPKNLVIDVDMESDLEEGEIVDDDGDAALGFQNAVTDNGEPTNTNNESGVKPAMVKMRRVQQEPRPEFGTPVAAKERKRHASGGYIKQSRPKPSPLEDDGKNKERLFFNGPDKNKRKDCDKTKHGEKDKRKQYNEKERYDERKKDHGRVRGHERKDHERRDHGRHKDASHMERARTTARLVSANHRQVPLNGRQM